MLVELDIRDFAIIDHLRLAFAPGLTVLTGETGAGKSIIVDALGAALGDKVMPEMVREGAARAIAEAVFDVSAYREPAPDEPSTDEAERRSLGQLLREYGLETDDGLLVLSREIAPGRSLARANGRVIPVYVLQLLGRALLDVHGQSEHLSLLQSSRHVDLLDRYAGLEARRERLAALVGRWRATRRQREDLARNDRDVARQLDFLTFQIDEISAAALQPAEEDHLTEERRILQNAERLVAGATEVHDLVQEGGRRGPGLVETIGRAARDLDELARIDARLGNARDLADSSLAQLQELAEDLRHYRDGLEFDPDRLAQLDDRLDLIHRLERKFGATIPDVLAFLDNAERERDGLIHNTERIAELAAEETALAEEAGRLADDLSAQRREAAGTLEAAVEHELADLVMGGARFAVQFQRQPDPNGVPLPGAPADDRWAIDRTGVDRLEFLVATNLGEPARPLAKIASGGEMSRLMLALKSVLSRADATPVLVFDEVDAGLGGRVGQVVGEKLAGLARAHQVLCVTHLPQIAAFGDRQYHVRKHLSDHRTITQITELTGADRVHELARMLGGRTLSDAVSASAAELIQSAEEWKVVASSG